MEAIGPITDCVGVKDAFTIFGLSKEGRLTHPVGLDEAESFDISGKMVGRFVNYREKL